MGKEKGSWITWRLLRWDKLGGVKQVRLTYAVLTVLTLGAVIGFMTRDLATYKTKIIKSFPSFHLLPTFSQKTSTPLHSHNTSIKLTPHVPPKLEHATIIYAASIQDPVLSWDGDAVTKGSPHWQRLDNQSDVFLYSAHYDDTDSPDVIRLVGIARDPLPYSDVCCRFFDADGRLIASNVSGKLYHFRKSNGARYLGSFVVCALKNDTDLPYSLSVSQDNGTTSQRTFHVVHYSRKLSSHATKKGNGSKQHTVTNSSILNNAHVNTTSGHKGTADYDIKTVFESATVNSDTGISEKRSNDSTYRWNITRCFPAFQKGYSSTVQVAEMVAASRALGVEHFVFYEESASLNLRKLLRVLANDGIAEVFPWNLHMTGKDVIYSAQFSAIQDCLYRHLHSSRYLLFGDVDELFVPRTHDTLLPLLDELFSKNPQCGAFLFRNTFFSFMSSTKMPPTDPKSVQFIHRHNLPILTHITRNKVVHKAGDRSKPALDPRKVSAGSVHVIESLRKGFQQCSVDPSNGFLQHYRHFTYGDARKDMDTVSDPYIWRLTDLIVKDVHNLLRKINVTLTAN